MAYITWRRAGLATAGALLAAAAALLPGISTARSSTGSVTTGSYTNAAGTVGYQLYVPGGYQQGKAVPLIVALHGCGETADQFRTLSRIDELAATKGFIVVYPEQSRSANQLGCWDWFQSNQVSRGTGEPSLIAGVTDQVRLRYTIDARRVYVTGLSAGGAMAAVMAVTYPDVYAAVGVGSGCEYTAGAACAGWQSANPDTAGQRAYQAMGSHKRVVPFMIFHGDQDTTVPMINAQQDMRAWQVTDDWADDGANNGSIPSAPTQTVQGQVPGGRAYTVKHYSDGHGHELAQFWVVNGMGHAWSGGSSGAQFSDPTGPSEATALYDFFMAHPAP